MKNIFATAFGHFMAAQERRASYYVDMARARQDRDLVKKAR